MSIFPPLPYTGKQDHTSAKIFRSLVGGAAVLGEITKMRAQN